MLENFLGMDTLKKGLTAYLNKYRFNNARTEDLWDAFTQVCIFEKNLYYKNLVLDLFYLHFQLSISLSMICNQIFVRRNETYFVVCLNLMYSFVRYSR